MLGWLQTCWRNSVRDMLSTFRSMFNRSFNGLLVDVELKRTFTHLLCLEGPGRICMMSRLAGGEGTSEAFVHRTAPRCVHLKYCDDHAVAIRVVYNEHN